MTCGSFQPSSRIFGINIWEMINIWENIAKNISKKLSGKYIQKLFEHAKKSLNKANQKIAETTLDFIGKKIADKSIEI